jgi:hypothetical protein
MENNMSDDFKDMDVEELQGYFSDFHKDYYGFRPRFATTEQWNNREWLVKHINDIHDAMDELKKTAEGRAELRANGWLIEEPFIEIED